MKQLKSNIIMMLCAILCCSGARAQEDNKNNITNSMIVTIIKQLPNTQCQLSNKEIVHGYIMDNASEWAQVLSIGGYPLASADQASLLAQDNQSTDTGLVDKNIDAYNQFIILGSFYGADIKLTYQCGEGFIAFDIQQAYSLRNAYKPTLTILSQKNTTIDSLSTLLKIPYSTTNPINGTDVAVNNEAVFGKMLITLH